jgi:hypothetical protein
MALSATGLVLCITLGGWAVANAVVEGRPAATLGWFVLAVGGGVGLRVLLEVALERLR